MSQTLETLERAYQRLEDQRHTLAATPQNDIDLAGELERLNDGLRTLYVFVMELAQRQPHPSPPPA